LSHDLFREENVSFLRNTVKTVISITSKRSQGSSVSIVSGYGLDDRTIEVRSPAEARGFFL
jgi:hypothetical protein